MKTMIMTVVKIALLGLFLIHGLSANAEEKTEGEARGKNEADVQLVNINTATEEELTELPRVGPVIAKRIVEFRAEHGNFETLEELMNVKGIGEKTFERLKPLIQL